MHGFNNGLKREVESKTLVLSMHSRFVGKSSTVSKRPAALRSSASADSALFHKAPTKVGALSFLRMQKRPEAQEKMLPGVAAYSVYAFLRAALMRDFTALCTSA